MAARILVATMPFLAAAQSALLRLAWAAAATLVATVATAAITVAALTVGAPQAQAATADNVTGWAWSASIGWISMNCTNTATCATSNFGVTLSETPGAGDRADLSGYGWSNVVGWVCFGMTCTGSTPEGGSAYAQYRVSFNGQNDQIFGWAKIINMGDDGWISLNCDKDVEAVDRSACATSNYFIRLNNANGAFHSGAVNDHWGWGSNATGTGAGWVDFSGVTTAWVLANLGQITRPEGVYEPLNPSAPGTHRSTFSVTFGKVPSPAVPNFSAAVGQLLECEILTGDPTAGPGKKIISKVMTSTVRNSTTTIDYTILPTDTVPTSGSSCSSSAQCPAGTQCVQNICIHPLWFLNVCRIAGASLGAACVTDANCGAGSICDETPGVQRCRTVVRSSLARRPIYTHGNTWTGLDSSQDQYTALKCNAGFSDEYFKNAAQCDFTGDASFSLAMRRGIPIEGNCSDSIDNDGNGQTDCSDRYCQGISYLCKQLPPAQCVYGAANDGMIDCSAASYEAGTPCCSRQPVAPGAAFSTVVNGLECKYREPNDGYFDCDCLGSAQNSTASGCYAPYYQSGDLCCSSASEVQRN